MCSLFMVRNEYAEITNYDHPYQYGGYREFSKFSKSSKFGRLSKFSKYNELHSEMYDGFYEALPGILNNALCSIYITALIIAFISFSYLTALALVSVLLPALGPLSTLIIILSAPLGAILFVNVSIALGIT